VFRSLGISHGVTQNREQKISRPWKTTVKDLLFFLVGMRSANRSARQDQAELLGLATRESRPPAFNSLGFAYKKTLSASFLRSATEAPGSEH